MIGCISSANAMLLVGFNSFQRDGVGLTTDSTPDESWSGWTGQINHKGAGFVTTGGSTDLFYGKDWPQYNEGLDIYSPVKSNNGYIDGGLNIMLSGETTVGGPVNALLFDAASVSEDASEFQISWAYWADKSKLGGPINSGLSPLLTVGPGATGNQTSDYTDFAVDLGSFFLPANGYYEIVWNVVSGVNNFKLDNIALVPEPGSMLGLGCLVGFGTLLRSRRRTGPAVIA